MTSMKQNHLVILQVLLTHLKVMPVGWVLDPVGRLRMYWKFPEVWSGMIMPLLISFLLILKKLLTIVRLKLMVI